ncbi:PhoX family protein [Chitinophaga sp. B61]|uniref:PhoX family protein n=2 Tax=Chitinophaga rhizophila TaxID=2866212 RepID=A0ABS7GH52_9BACT|nr:PhoX family protein [Chitinophaga rhizophila]
MRAGYCASNLSTRMKLNSLMSQISPLVAAVLMAGCSNNDNPSTPPETGLPIKTQSVTPSLVKALPGFDNLKIYPLISSDDTLSGSPAFRYGAQPDGAGMIKNPNGDGYVMITNHEILFSVSRVFLDKELKPVKGEYIVDAQGGSMRLCSATMADPAEHGFGPMFLTAGETDGESMIHAIDPMGSADLKKTNRTVPALGKCSAENAVPLSKNAFPGKTAIFIGEDESSRQGLGQVNLYLSDVVGDLSKGKLYMLRRVDQNIVETDMEVGKAYDVEFVAYEDVATSTGAELAAQTVAQKAIQFARVEDLDYGKGSVENNRKLYFTATGVSQSDKKTPVAGLTMWGRLYELVLDASNPLKGKLTPLVDGNVDPGNSLVNPDNVCVTQNFVYVQEDGDSYYADNKHDGRIWQYNIATKALKPMLEMDHRRNDATFNAKYNPGNDTRLGSWEYGAMYDISDLVGKPNTFVVNIHPHTWTDSKFVNADGSGLTTNKEGGQTVIITGIEK